MLLPFFPDSTKKPWEMVLAGALKCTAQESSEDACPKCKPSIKAGYTSFTDFCTTSTL